MGTVEQAVTPVLSVPNCIICKIINKQISQLWCTFSGIGFEACSMIFSVDEWDGRSCTWY